MPTPPLQPAGAPSAPRLVPRTRVWTRESWSDAWTERPHLEPILCVNEAAPGRHQALFLWRAGSMRRPGDLDFTEVDPLSIRGHWVWVEHVVPDEEADVDEGEEPPLVHARTLFVGRFAADDADEGGLLPYPAITQRLTAYGVDQELDLTPVAGSLVTNPDYPDPEPDKPLWMIDTGLVFNEPLSEPAGEDRTADEDDADPAPALRGNRSANPLTIAGQELYHFSADNGRWTALEAIEHLLRLHYQQLHLPEGDRPDVPALPISGQLDALAVLPAEEFDPTTGSVLQALYRLIDRRQGLGFTIRYGPQPVWREGGTPIEQGDPPRYATAPTEILGLEADQPSLYVYSIAEVDLPLEDDEIIPKNPDQISVAPDVGDGIVSDFLFGKSAARRYGRIVVQGERIVTTFTLSFADGTLQPGWTPEEESDYKTAAGGDDDALNDDIRRSEHFAHVYSRFIVGSLSEPGGGAWRFMVGDGAGGDLHFVVPIIDADGEFVSASEDIPTYRAWADAYRILPRLPMRGPQGLFDGGADANRPARDDDYRPPVIFAKDGNDRWFPLHLGNEEIPGAHIRPLTNRFGLEIILPVPHLAALNHFDGAAATKKEPAFDYETIVATVAVEADQRLRVQHDIAGGDPNHVLYIDVPGAAFHFVNYETVVDLEVVAGAVALRRYEQSELEVVIRNDAPRLRRIAARAAAWYGVDRQTVRYTRTKFDEDTDVGALITTTIEGYEPQPVNTPVTQVVFDCRDGVMSVRTSYQELA